MTRVNTNVSSLTAQNRLQRTNNDLQTALTRLSTGLRINSGKDDPAGLIASESLRSDITSIGKALTNTQRANQIIGTADSALGQVSSLLNDIRGLVTEAANKGGLSDDEIAANQLQVDSSLEAINRIAQTTTFQGRRLLDGSLDFQVQQGNGFNTVKDLQIDSANLGAAGSVSVGVEISAAATRALVTATVPAVGASAKATTSFEFSDTTIGSEATGLVNLTQSFFGGTEATAAVDFDAARVALNEATGVVTLGGGAAFRISAKDGTSVDGIDGNAVKLNITTGSSATSGSYDAATNTLNLALQTGTTGAAAVTALNAISGVSSKFQLSAGNTTNVVATDSGIRTGALTGGTEEIPSTKTQASSTVVPLGAGRLNFSIAAVAGGAFDGIRANTTEFTYTYSDTEATSASYDAAQNKVALVINTVTPSTNASVQTTLNAGLSGQFVLSAVGGTLAGANVAATAIANTLTTGTAPVAGTTTALAAGSRAGFQLTAKDGGAADGLIGNSTALELIAGSQGVATTASYDATANKLRVTIATGATVNDISKAINDEGTFVAANTRFGTAKFKAADLAVSPTLLTGANTTAASSFRLTAVDGGLADGAVGNSTKIIFTAGASGALTDALYDAASNELRVTVATNATIQNVTDAISNNVGSVFTVGNVTNGSAKFYLGSSPTNTDLGTKSSLLTGGTTNASSLKDELVISATASGAAANGVTVTFQEDATITAGAPTAAAVVTGSATNILVKVSNIGNTKLSDIADAISGISGGAYAATLSPTSNGDGFYKGALEAPPAVKTLAGGITGGGLAADITFQLTGGSGSEVFKFQKGATTTNILNAINLLQDATGIQASFNSTDNKLEFRSSDFGSAGVVGIEVLSEGSGGTFASGLTGGPRAVGTDIQATVNGTVATGKGNQISLNTSTLSLSFTVTDGSQTSVNFNITGGGAQFQLGPDVVSNQQARLGISSLNTAKIGGVSGKLLELASSGSSSLTKDVTRASAIVDQVINKVTTLRGRLGAFQRTALDSNTASLNDTLANLNEAQSSIRDADFAKESANLTRAQILVQSGTSVLGIANQSSQSVLSLLR